MVYIKVRGKWYNRVPLMNPTVTPPIRERVEPVASEPEWIAALRDANAFGPVVLTDVYGNHVAYGTEILESYDNKPATIDDAIALLVREGATYHEDTDVYATGLGCVGRGVRILILPHRSRA